MKRKLITAALVLAPLLVTAQPQSTRSPATASTTGGPNSSERSAAPAWLPIPIPPSLYEKWRKYGPWDYKQQGFQYRDFTQFNFGATGNAAGYDQKSLLALAQASKPTPDDVDGLDDPELQIQFTREAEAFDKVRSMAEQDVHVIRIAPDYTLLDTDSKWPRENLGFSEARWNEYRSLFKTLSFSEGIVRTEDFPGAIFFVARVKGLCTGGSSAGYVYSVKPLTPTTKTPKEALDSEARKNPGKHHAYVFKPLTTNWYTFYEIDW